MLSLGAILDFEFLKEFGIRFASQVEENGSYVSHCFWLVFRGLYVCVALPVYVIQKRFEPRGARSRGGHLST